MGRGKRDPSIVIPRCIMGLAAAVVLILATTLRLDNLDSRPMHLDETVQAYKFGELLETGSYIYDPIDFHGPVLLYSTLPAAWITGVGNFAQLDESLLRSVPALYGIALVLLVAAAGRALGVSATLAALLVALSTPFVYYSRYYIMEMPLVFLLGAALFCLHAYLTRPSALLATAVGVFGGLIHATKETGAISFLAMGVALAVVGGLKKARGQPVLPSGFRWTHLLWAAGPGLAVSACLFSAGFQNPQAILDSITTYFSYLKGRPGGAEHHKPFFYYLSLLGWKRQEGVLWTESVTLALAIVGALYAWLPASQPSPHRCSHRFLTLYAAVSALVYSAIPYKTPWTLLSCYFPLILLAAYGALSLVTTAGRAGRPALLLAAVAAAALLGTSQLRELRQTRLATSRYAADNRNPWVYGHTTVNLLRMIERIETYSTLHPQGKALPIRVYDAEGWPLPWYFRRFSDVLYSAQLPENPSPGDLIIVTTTQEERLRPIIESSHTIDNYYGLRHDYLVTLFVENGLWERFLQSVTAPSNTP